MCNKKTYSAWGEKESEDANCLVEGEGPPCFANGEVDETSSEFFFKIYAASWEEAMAIYHLRQGWEPYNPNGEPKQCPSCNAIYYPEGSGQCWKCSYENT